MNRRRFLAAMGLTAGSLALPSVWPRARAAAVTPPKRLIVFASYHGAWYDGWKMRPGGLVDDKDGTADLVGLGVDAFSQSLAPLWDVREHLNVVDGLCMLSAEVDTPGWRHEKGKATALTGRDVVWREQMPLGVGPSIDQAVVAAIARPDQIPSLELGVGRVESGYSMVYRSGPLERLLWETDPRVAFQRTFGVHDAQGGEDAIQAGQPSVLDWVASQHDALARKLSGEDRRRLEQHRDLVRQLELRMVAGATCDPGFATPLASEGASSYARDWEGMRDIALAALSCDLTRVVTFQMADVPYDLLGSPPADVHFGYAHSEYNDPVSAEMMTRYTAVHAQQVRDLIAALRDTPDGEGSLLDSTLVVWANELGDGTHGFHNWPAVLAGGGWAFRGGRYHRLAPSSPIPVNVANAWLPRTGPPHQRLLTSVGRAMGLDISSFGETEVVGEDVTVDATGPLSVLT